VVNELSIQFLRGVVAVTKNGRIFMKFTQRSDPFKTKTNFYRLVFSQDCAFDILFSFATKITFRFVSVKVEKIDFESFKVIFDNVRISGIRKFLSILIRPLFSYNLKKPHKNSLEGVRERLKTLMLQTKMIALYIHIIFNT